MNNLSNKFKTLQKKTKRLLNKMRTSRIESRNQNKNQNFFNHLLNQIADNMIFGKHQLRKAAKNAMVIIKVIQRSMSVDFAENVYVKTVLIDERI